MYTVHYFLSFFLLFNAVRSDSCSFPIITNFSQETCINKAENNNTYFYLKKNNCISTCGKYDYAANPQPLVDLQCPLGYKDGQRCQRDPTKTCNTTSDCKGSRPSKCVKKCFPIQGSCMSYHAKTVDFTNTYYSAMKFKPTCLDDGAWAPKQCKGDETGRCFCFDSDGKRIFGEALFKDSKEMTCACSRKREEIITSGKRAFLFLHCDSKGNYEPLQCDGVQCWCAESKTGDLTSAVVPMSAVKYLPCYNVNTFGDQYFRQCDSEKYAQEIQKREQTYHGVTNFYFRYLKCDGDGAFGPYNVSESRPYCTWRDGTTIGSFMGEGMDDLATINCNCARDQKRYGSHQHCLPTGDYNPTQTTVSGEKYCVDSDGYSISDVNPSKECNKYY